MDTLRKIIAYVLRRAYAAHLRRQRLTAAEVEQRLRAAEPRIAQLDKQFAVIASIPMVVGGLYFFALAGALAVLVVGNLYAMARNAYYLSFAKLRPRAFLQVKARSGSTALNVLRFILQYVVFVWVNYSLAIYLAHRLQLATFKKEVIDWLDAALFGANIMLQGALFPIVQNSSWDPSSLELKNRWDLAHLFTLIYQYYFVYFAAVFLLIRSSPKTNDDCPSASIG